MSTPMYIHRVDTDGDPAVHALPSSSPGLGYQHPTAVEPAARVRSAAVEGAEREQSSNCPGHRCIGAPVAFRIVFLGNN